LRLRLLLLLLLLLAMAEEFRSRQPLLWLSQSLSLLQSLLA